jgi:hypothetical protein
MSEKGMDDWGIKKCPLVDRQCMKGQCAWWVEDDKECAIKRIATKTKE